MDEINNKEEEIDFSAILRALLRRKKIIYITSSIAISASFIFSLYQRIYNPIYQGSFTFLVNNPLENDSGGNGGKIL